jgi:diguanylate cyclase (GGDEF)-like protein
MVDLESAATTDLLTGLPNRSRIITIAETEFHRADRLETTVSVLMVDIDHFKSVNDTHGHAAGDTMLRAFAEICMRAVRGVDRMGRIGGEEFLVVLGDTDENVALDVDERIRGAVQAMAVTTLQGEIQITVSIGTATRRSPEESIDLVLHRADQALYRAKAEGRNRISTAAA